MWLISLHDMVCYVKPKIIFGDFWDEIYSILPVISLKNVPKDPFLFFWDSDSQTPTELKDSYCFKAKTQILDQILTSTKVVTLIMVYYFFVEDFSLHSGLIFCKKKK